MFYCEKCGCADACERTDLVDEPVLCDNCYAIEVLGWDCFLCNNSYYTSDDRLRCKLNECHPDYT